SDKPEQELRRVAQELHEQWTQRGRGSDQTVRALESRYQQARKAIDSLLAGRTRSRQSAAWHTLAAKERLCEELDQRVYSHAGDGDVAAVTARWAALPALPAAWEKAM